MDKPESLKSRQFQTKPSLEPITRTTSFHSTRHLFKAQTRQSSPENNYNLATIVNTIIDRKPRTAFRSSEKRS